MSLLEGIQRKKTSLNKSKTTITTLSGAKYEEVKDASGNFTTTELKERHAGYIVDSKPDLQVADILAYLSLGSQDVIADRELLILHGITHILSLGVSPPLEHPNISYKFIDILDTPEENLLKVVPITNELIDAVGNVAHGKVFVHCNAGCSRAPSIVIAYLMYKLKIKYLDAYNMVRKLRYIRPNDGFVQQLKLYQQSLQL